MNNIEELLEAEGATAEANKDAPLKLGTKVSRGHGRARTLQVRLNEDEYAALDRLAEARRLPVSTAARSILLAAIEPGIGTPTAHIERLRRELDLLSQQIA
jgi:hypothetical protein